MMSLTEGAGAISAVATAAGLLWSGGRKVFRTVRGVLRQLEDNAVKLNTALENHGRLERKLDSIEAQTKANGGSTLRDALIRIEALLMESDVRARAVADELVSPLWETDDAGRCTWVNRAFALMVERPASDMIENNWVNAIAPDEREDVWEQWHAAVSQHRKFQALITYLTPDGRRVRARVEGARLVRKDGKPVGYFGTATPLHRAASVTGEVAGPRGA